MANVDKSFAYLHYSGMITEPENNGALTSLGRFAGNLPVDLQLGLLINYGIALGVGAEAVILAAALSQPQACFGSASLSFICLLCFIILILFCAFVILVGPNRIVRRIDIVTSLIVIYISQHHYLNLRFVFNCTYVTVYRLLR
jgi:hypothetical protein